MKTKSNQKYGIVGGMGAYASALLHRKVVEGVSMPTSDADYPSLMLINQGLPGFGVDAKLTKEAVYLLKESVQGLKSLGCQKVWVACNSVHTQKEEWWDNSICVSWTEAFEQTFPENALILGSGQVYRQHLYSRGVYPSPEIQSLVGDCIDAVIRGQHRSDKNKCLSCWNSLWAKINIKNVVLGCTELSVCAEEFGTPSDIHIQDGIDCIAHQILEAHRRRSFT